MLEKGDQAPVRPRRKILQSCLLLSVMGHGLEEWLFKFPNEKKEPMTDELFIIIRRFSTAVALGQRVVSATDYPFTLVPEEKRVASRGWKFLTKDRRRRISP